jgi:hypothetical protein
MSRGIETGAHATELAIQQAGDILHISRDKKGIQESCQEVDGESNLSLGMTSRVLFPVSV